MFDEAGGSVYTFLNSLKSLIKDLKTMQHVKYIVIRGSIYPLPAGIYLFKSTMGTGEQNVK